MKESKDYIVFPLDVPTVDSAKDFIERLGSHTIYAGAMGISILYGEFLLRNGFHGNRSCYSGLYKYREMDIWFPYWNDGCTYPRC